MFIDEVEIVVKGGDGGNGIVSFVRNAQTAKGGPDGGNGGNGGSVYFQGSTNKNDLSDFTFKKTIQAENGVNGGKNKLFGRNGKDITVLVPVGTTVVDKKSSTLITFDNTTDKICIARGGQGGKGNNEFKSAINQTPTVAERGQDGEEKEVSLILKIIADIGFIGFPNSGKSTLLSKLTNARPKIGNYAFTTLEPNVGVFHNVLLADIPGIIEGASKGKGLGLRFLKHIEKAKVLFYCIDSSGEDPYKIYTAIQNEFKNYSENLLSKKSAVILTKIDLIDKNHLDLIKNQFKGNKLLLFSEYDDKTVESIKRFIASL